jgi:type VII secretion protein EccB
MQSRRDHMQAYQFSVARLVHAVAAGDTAAAESPFRRANLGVVAGTVLGVLFGGGCLVYGLISPAAGQAWRTPGAIIVEKETGTRYLLVDGQLRPTANYTSALLAAGQKVSVQYVPRATLAGIPVGSTLGIPGAPDELPAATALLPGTWSLCLRTDGSTVVGLGSVLRGGQPLDGRRVLMSSDDPARPGDYLVVGAVKYPLPDGAVLTALGLGDQQPLPAAPAFLNALPTGRPVTPAAVQGAGKQGPAIGGRPAEIGALFSTDAGGAVQNYVLLSDGLAPITRTEAALFAVAGAPAATAVSPSAIATARMSADRSLLSRLPDLLSGQILSGGAPCVTQSSPGRADQTHVVVLPAAPTAEAASVQVPARGGTLIEPPGGTADNPAPEYLVTDTGEKFPVSGNDALGALGYGSATAQIVPRNVIDLIPSGPELDTAAAKKGASWPSG